MDEFQRLTETEKDRLERAPKWVKDLVGRLHEQADKADARLREGLSEDRLSRVRTVDVMPNRRPSLQLHEDDLIRFQTYPRNPGHYIDVRFADRDRGVPSPPEGWDNMLTIHSMRPLLVMPQITNQVYVCQEKLR